MITQTRFVDKLATVDGKIMTLIKHNQLSVDGQVGNLTVIICLIPRNIIVGMNDGSCL